MTTQLNEVETLIDGANVKEVLSLMATVCKDKGDHIEASYDDTVLAARWHRTAKMLNDLANKLPNTPGIGYGE